MKILVTGGCGFIGSNFIRYWLGRYPDDRLLNLDLLTYAGTVNNVKEVENNSGYTFTKGDIGDFDLVDNTVKAFKPDCIINFAAESHNSLAILNPTLFFKTNLLGTQNLLEVARKNKVPRFHHISTCEVYGDLDLESKEKFKEDSPYKPNTPYNASKAAADLAVRAYYKTFHLPVTISNCGNNYGPYQFPEKLIPLFITNLLENKKIPLYKNSQNRREWIHVLDHCKAVDLILKKGKIGEMYNIGTGVEKSIEEIAEIILGVLNKPVTMKTYVEDRPGHDRRYLLDSSKIRNELGWEPEIDFEQGIVQTIHWYKENHQWWAPLKKKILVQEDKWQQNPDTKPPAAIKPAQKMKGIILAGGKGTRLYPLTSTMSKQLLPVYDKPMIYYPLSVLMLAGIREILIISNAEYIDFYKKLFGEGSQLGITISYKIQDEPRGIADAFIVGEDFIGGDNVALILGDNLFFGQGFGPLLREASSLEEGAIIFGYYVKNPGEFGIVEFNEHNEVISVEEKPIRPKSNFAITGLYFYDNKVVEIAKNLKPSARGELEITDVNKEYLRKNKLKVSLLGRGFAWLDTGSHENLLEAAKFVETIQKRQGKYIACIEEVAYRMGYINKEQLHKLAQPLLKTEYGRYFLNIDLSQEELFYGKKD